MNIDINMDSTIRGRLEPMKREMQYATYANTEMVIAGTINERMCRIVKIVVEREIHQRIEDQLRRQIS